MTSFVHEPEWCPHCEAPTEIVDDHVEVDYRYPDLTFRVFDLECGHSLNWRAK